MSKMLKFVGICGAIAIMSGTVALASVPFDIGANGASGNHWALGTGWGTQSGQLDAVFNVNPDLPNVAFSLGVGQSKNFNFGSVQLRESDISGDETNNLGVTAYLSFVLPNVGQIQIPGDAVAITGSVSDWANDLKIAFDPVYVNIDQCGKFKIDLTDLCFDKCETLCVDACVTLCSEPCPAVPEPMTLIVWSLLGASFYGVRVWRRRGAGSGGDSTRRPWAPENRQAIRRIFVRP